MRKGRCKICDSKLINGFCSDCGHQDRYSLASLKDPGASQIKNKKAPKIIWLAASILLLVLPVLLHTYPFQMVAIVVRQQQIITSIPPSTYDDVSRELAAQGELVDMSLEEGNYIVGIDIPEGIYQIKTVGHSASLYFKDDVNQIDFSSSLRKDSDNVSSYLEDVRLYQGTILCIESGEILFSSSNAQVDKLEKLPPNPETKTYSVEDGAVSGADFPEGTYDIVLSSGEYGYIRVFYPARHEDALGFAGVMGTQTHTLTRFRNVEFPKGTLLEISDVGITLVPSTRNSLEHQKGGEKL